MLKKSGTSVSFIQHFFICSRYLSYETLGIKEFQLEDYKEAIELLRAGKIAKAVFAVDSSQ